MSQASRVDFDRLVETAQDLARRTGITSPPQSEVRSELQRVLEERDLIGQVDDSLISEQEAAQALLARLQTWMLVRQAKSPADIPSLDYEQLENEVITALFAATSDSDAREGFRSIPKRPR